MTATDRPRTDHGSTTDRPLSGHNSRPEGWGDGQTGLVAKDEDILAEVNKLVAEEQELRGKLQRHDISESEEHERLRVIEMALDQCWDLLRQRRALRETGGDPREAEARPASQVEDYLN